jgi:hypothetical protein
LNNAIIVSSMRLFSLVCLIVVIVADLFYYTQCV